MVGAVPCRARFRLDAVCIGLERMHRKSAGFMSDWLEVEMAFIG